MIFTSASSIPEGGRKFLSSIWKYKTRQWWLPCTFTRRRFLEGKDYWVPSAEITLSNQYHHADASDRDSACLFGQIVLHLIAGNFFHCDLPRDLV